MGVFRRKREETPGRPRAVLAAAMPIEGPAGKQAWHASTSDVQWQKQAWYYYDAVGELWFAFNWLASAVSRATLYAAELDPETGLITGPSEDARAQAAAATILGGVEDRPQLLSTMALHWQVAGETYILVIPQGGSQPDRWLVLSRNGLREQGGTWSFQDPHTGVWTKLRSGQDRVIRVWSPHPDCQTHANSAMRAGNVICNEIEKASQNIAARLDSRLAGNGIMFIPNEIDFPTQDGEAANAESFMKLLLDAGEASISNPGSAAAHVPIMAQVPAEYIAALANGHIDLSTQMDSAVPELRSQAFERLGRTLDMSKEIALGQVAEANHWTAWQIEETTYKIHAEPFLLKLAMALVKEFYRSVLTAMGVPNPERFVLAWDITEVVSRPDDTEQTNYLWDQGLISADYVRSKYGVPDDAIQTEEEHRRWLAERMALSTGAAALDNPSIAEELGFDSAPAPEPAAPPQIEAAPQDSTGRMPERDTTPPEPDAGLVAAAELVVFDALSRAGGRLLTPAYRGQFKTTPRHELHTVIPVTDVPTLMEGSFQFTERVAAAFGRDPIALHHLIKGYVEDRLRHGKAHDRDVLRRFL